MTVQDDLALALRLAGVASEIALGFWGGTVRSELKPDGSPVGEADLAIERELIWTLRQQRPDDAIFSEERGALGDGSRRWILDPLDGTALFLAGQGGWGTLITLQVDGVSTVGVITRPLDGAVWHAVRGGGAMAGDRPVRVSDAASLGAARVSAWQPVACPEVDVLRELPGWVEPDANAFLRVIEGQLDVVVSLGGFVWDHAPTVLLLEEAGGVYRDRKGGRRLDVQGGVYANAHLCDVAGRLIGWYR